MASDTLAATFKAFGGWTGLCAFYFAGLTFPLYYARRTAQDSSKYDTARQSRELRIASSILLVTAALCYVYPSDIYILPHVAADKHMHARWLDLAFHVSSAYTVAPLLSFFRLGCMLKADARSLDADIPSPSAETWTINAKRRVSRITSKYLAESTWLFLFSIYFVSISAGLLELSVGKVVQHEISWYIYPLCNLAGHLAVFHALTVLTEAWFHPIRVRTLEAALECESREERDEFWAGRMRAVGVREVLRGAVCVRRRASDCESDAATRPGALDVNAVDEKMALHEQ